MSFPYKIRQCFVQFHDSICAMCFLRQQTNVHMRKRFPEWVHCQVNIAFFTGCKKIKQRRISFVLGYLRMILWKISTAISIKHRILATINIEKKINSGSLYAFRTLSQTFRNHIHNRWGVPNASDIFLSKNDSPSGKTRREASEGMEYDFYFTEYDFCPVWSRVLILTHCPIKLIYWR